MNRLSMWFAYGLFICAIGNAQSSNDIEISVSSGVVIPSSPMSFANYWKMQYGGSIGAGTAVTPSITIVGTFEYYQFQLNTAGINKTFDTKYIRDIWIFDDVSLTPAAKNSSVTTLSAQLLVDPPELSGPLSPYFLVGAGVMWFSLSEISLPIKSSLTVGSSIISMGAQQRIIGGDETIPFAQFGLGMNYRVSESLKIFIEARYTRGFSKGLGTTYLPLAAGIKFSI